MTENKETIGKDMTVRTPVDKLKSVLSMPSIQEQFKNALKENSSLFVSSIIDLVGSDKGLQKCNQCDVIRECLKAATLKLPINKNLGLAWIIPYGTSPTFQMGYRGWIQLGLRTGQYRYLNADMIYEGETVEVNKLNGSVEIFGEQESDKVLGYFSHLETIQGFKKTIFWSKERVTNHAKQYSKSWGKKDSAWTNEFDKMALKTLIKELLSKWGVMSVELQKAFDSDHDDMAFDARLQREADQEADDFGNKETIDIDPGEQQQEEQQQPIGPSF